MEFEDRIAKLEKDLHTLRAEYDQYFLGLVKLPPEKLAKSVAREVRSLTTTRITNTALRFRAQQAISRFNTFQQYWTRTLKDLEEGRTPRRKLAAPPPAAPPAEPDVFTISTAEGEKDGMDAFLRSLQDEYRKVGGGKSPDLDRLRQAVEKQNETLRAKYGVDEVSYRILSEGGKIRLKATPVTPPKK